jgi:hypothetical protein
VPDRKRADDDRQQKAEAALGRFEPPDRVRPDDCFQRLSVSDYPRPNGCYLPPLRELDIVPEAAGHKIVRKAQVKYLHLDAVGQAGQLHRASDNRG